MRLRYRFEPGAEDDGVTVEVPLALLARLRPDGFDRLVPGLREVSAEALAQARTQSAGIDVPWEADVGIFGELCDRAAVPRDGDRIEIYRPLKLDPKESRRERARARKAAPDREPSRLPSQSPKDWPRR